MSLFTTFRTFFESLLSPVRGHDQEEAPTLAPGTVIFRTQDGRQLVIDDLYGATGTIDVREGKLLNVTGKVQYEIVGGRSAPPEAHSLHQQGREAGADGDYKRAVDLLERASKLAPNWPYPIYDTAFTYLLMGDSENARKFYSRTIELSPRGFFTAITAVDVLTREQTGTLPAGTYAIWLSLESMNDLTRQAEVLGQLIAKVPHFAPAWQKLACLTDDDAERLALIEKGLAVQPDPETKGMLVINKALVLNLKGEKDAAVRLLGELALDPSSTFGTEHSAKAALAILTTR